MIIFNFNHFDQLIFLVYEVEDILGSKIKKGVEE